MKNVRIVTREEGSLTSTFEYTRPALGIVTYTPRGWTATAVCDRRRTKVCKEATNLVIEDNRRGEAFVGRETPHTKCDKKP